MQNTPVALAVFAFVLVILGSAACDVHGDPQGPGATGSVALQEGLLLEGFVALQLRAFPNAGDTLEVPEDEQFPLEERIELATVGVFPFSYSLVPGFGISDTQQWRVLAWLSANEEPSPASAPTPTHPAGSAAFDVSVCAGVDNDRFCGVTDGVDITILAR